MKGGDMRMRSKDHISLRARQWIKQMLTATIWCFYVIV